MKPNKASEQEDSPIEQEGADDTDSTGAPANGVDVPEAFQIAVHKLTKGATKPHISHMRSKINQREDTMRNEENAKKGKNGKMSMDDAPSSVGDTY